jgi:signal transduction histidine kinase
MDCDFSLTFVEMHDGDIAFESETGKGTTFTIRILLKRLSQEK